MPRSLLIAGSQSGVGKTTIAAGLIAACCRRGLRVQPFKVGPDYIDPGYHRLAAGRACRNLDTWMLPPPRVRGFFDRALAECDVAIIEGVMGVFDGVDYGDESGSSAEVAKLLRAPVFVVLDAARVARSAAAVALGVQRFDPLLPLAGFIVNRVGSEAHGRGVAGAIEEATGLPVLGWLPRQEQLHVPERHLGLVPTAEPGRWDTFLGAAAEMVEQHLDVERMLELAAGRRMEDGGWRMEDGGWRMENGGWRMEDRSPIIEDREPGATIAPSSILHPRSSILHPPFSILHPRPTIAVARDEAFHFTYDDNLDLLRAAGAELAFFSPLSDAELPPGTGGVVLSGGFPEVYAGRLAANAAMHTALRRAHERRLPIYAECGGLMYLTEAIVDPVGRRQAMVGLLPGYCVMESRATLGYRLARAAGDSWLLKAGETLRGHEFHYSSWQGRPAELPPAFRVTSPRGASEPRPEGACLGSLWASYVHLHFACRDGLAERFVAACG